MSYWDVPSGVVVQAGETVSVLVVFEDTVRVWPTPVPAVIVTGRPIHRLAGHAFAFASDLVVSWSVVLVCAITYWDVPSGVVVHADETVRVLPVLEDTVFVWPAPVPALIVTTRPAQRLAVHALVPDLVVSWSVVLVSVPLAVPASAALPASAVAVPASPVPVPASPVPLPLSPMVATPSSPIVAVPSSPVPVPASEPGAMTLNVAATSVSSIVNTSDPAKLALVPFTLPTKTRVLAPPGPVWFSLLHAASASVASAITPQAICTPRRVVWSSRSSCMTAPDDVSIFDANRFLDTLRCGREKVHRFRWHR